MNLFELVMFYSYWKCCDRNSWYVKRWRPSIQKHQ